MSIFITTSGFFLPEALQSRKSISVQSRGLPLEIMEAGEINDLKKKGTFADRLMKKSIEFDPQLAYLYRQSPSILQIFDMSLTKTEKINLLNRIFNSINIPEKYRLLLLGLIKDSTDTDIALNDLGKININKLNDITKKLGFDPYMMIKDYLSAGWTLKDILSLPMIEQGITKLIQKYNVFPSDLAETLMSFIKNPSAEDRKTIAEFAGEDASAELESSPLQIEHVVVGEKPEDIPLEPSSSEPSSSEPSSAESSRPPSPTSKGKAPVFSEETFDKIKSEEGKAEDIIIGEHPEIYKSQPSASSSSSSYDEERKAQEREHQDQEQEMQEIQKDIEHTKMRLDKIIKENESYQELVAKINDEIKTTVDKRIKDELKFVLEGTLNEISNNEYDYDEYKRELDSLANRFDELQRIHYQPEHTPKPVSEDSQHTTFPELTERDKEHIREQIIYAKTATDQIKNEIADARKNVSLHEEKLRKIKEKEDELRTKVSSGEDDAEARLRALLEIKSQELMKYTESQRRLADLDNSLYETSRDIGRIETILHGDESKILDYRMKDISNELEFQKRKGKLYSDNLEHLKKTEAVLTEYIKRTATKLNKMNDDERQTFRDKVSEKKQIQNEIEKIREAFEDNNINIAKLTEEKTMISHELSEQRKAKEEKRKKELEEKRKKELEEFAKKEAEKEAERRKEITPTQLVEKLSGKVTLDNIVAKLAKEKDSAKQKDPTTTLRDTTEATKLYKEIIEEYGITDAKTREIIKNLSEIQSMKNKSAIMSSINKTKVIQNLPQKDKDAIYKATASIDSSAVMHTPKPPPKPKAKAKAKAKAKVGKKK